MRGKKKTMERMINRHGGTGKNNNSCNIVRRLWRTVFSYLESAIRFNDYVGGFEVPVDDAGGMEMLDAAKHLIEQIRHSFVVQIHLNDLAQIGIHQFHDQIHVLQSQLLSVKVFFFFNFEFLILQGKKLEIILG